MGSSGPPVGILSRVVTERHHEVMLSEDLKWVNLRVSRKGPARAEVKEEGWGERRELVGGGAWRAGAGAGTVQVRGTALGSRKGCESSWHFARP